MPDNNPSHRKAFQIQKMLHPDAPTHKKGRLISFLYELMRDHLTPGRVERIVYDCWTAEVGYTNRQLADYAEKLADFLTSSPKEDKENAEHRSVGCGGYQDEPED